jgi:hypothetical protein
MAWPFLFVLNADSSEMGWALVNGPIITAAQQDELAQLRRSGYRFAGMSSYQTFPWRQDDDPLDYEVMCEAWCHCFREPDRFLRATFPRALISVSDFTDYHRISPETILPVEGDFDFIYCGACEDWKRAIKNWTMARRCITAIHRELGLRCLVIGQATHDFPDAEGVTFSEPLPWHLFLSHLMRARFLLAPNRLDASPRVLAEALCLDVPIVVNHEILGGWKYVNRFTGTFFKSPEDSVIQVRSCLGRETAPRQWFRANYGPWVAGARLLRLLRRVDPAIGERFYLRLTEER